MDCVRLLIVAGVVCALSLTVAPAAEADKYCAAHGEDLGCVEDGHITLTSCDREADGHFVRSWGIDAANGNEHDGPWDQNGSQAGCDSRIFLFPNPANWFAWVRACEEVVGCSPYKLHP